MNPILSQAGQFWSEGQYFNALKQLILFLVAVDSIGSILLRAAVWGGISVAILIGVDSYEKNKGEAVNLKSSLGFFLLFIVSGGILIYLLFGFNPLTTTVSAKQ